MSVVTAVLPSAPISIGNTNLGLDRAHFRKKPERACASFANAINSHSQVVGGTFSCQDGTHARAFLWKKGSMIDLNSVTPANSSLQLVVAYGINDRGEIVGEGVPPGVPPTNYSSQGYAFLLIPCDEKHGDSEGCEEGGGDNAVLRTKSNEGKCVRTPMV